MLSQRVRKEEPRAISLGSLRDEQHQRPCVARAPRPLRKVLVDACGGEGDWQRSGRDGPVGLGSGLTGPCLEQCLVCEMREVPMHHLRVPVDVSGARGTPMPHVGVFIRLKRRFSGVDPTCLRLESAASSSTLLVFGCVDHTVIGQCQLISMDG
jgi:hypothetical protein